MDNILPICDGVGESNANIRGREDLTFMQRNPIPCLQADAPALGLDDRLDFFGDVFPLLVDMDAVELGQIARDPGGVARV